MITLLMSSTAAWLLLWGVFLAVLISREHPPSQHPLALLDQSSIDA